MVEDTAEKYLRKVAENIAESPRGKKVGSVGSDRLWIPKRGEGKNGEEGMLEEITKFHKIKDESPL